MDINSITISGTVSRMERKSFGEGKSFVNIGLARNNNKKVAGEWKKETEWFNAVYHGVTYDGRDGAEALLSKVEVGDTLVVTGKLKNREWTSQDGTKKSATEIHFERANYVVSKKGSVASKKAPVQSTFEEDMPF